MKIIFLRCPELVEMRGWESKFANFEVVRKTNSIIIMPMLKLG